MTNWWTDAGDKTKATEKRRARIAYSLFLSVAMFWIACLLSGGCSEPSNLADEIPPSPLPQLILTEDMHPDGWGLTDCLLCHQVFQIHLKATNPEVNIEDIRKAVEQGGQSSCVFCHGTNGT